MVGENLAVAVKRGCDPARASASMACARASGPVSVAVYTARPIASGGVGSGASVRRAIAGSAALPLQQIFRDPGRLSERRLPLPVCVEGPPVRPYAP